MKTLMRLYSTWSLFDLLDADGLAAGTDVVLIEPCPRGYRMPGNFFNCWLAPAKLSGVTNVLDEYRILTSKWAGIKLLARARSIHQSVIHPFPAGALRIWMSLV